MATTLPTGMRRTRRLDFVGTILRAVNLAVLPGLLLAAGVSEARSEPTPLALRTHIDPGPDTYSAGGRLASRTAEPVLQMRKGLTKMQDDCAGGVVKDDGSLETGYGWVPSVIDGVYVQEFGVHEFPSRGLDSVCVCWLRTQEDSDVSFEVVFFEDIDGGPAETPYASVAAVASSVPEGVASGGAFYEVDVSGTVIRGRTIYIGVRWNPSVDQFFFVCADHSPETDPVNVFYIDDRADEWGSALDTPDPIFIGHRAIMVRATAESAAEFAVPGLGPTGAAALALLLATAGWLLLTRR